MLPPHDSRLQLPHPFRCIAANASPHDPALCNGEQSSRLLSRLGVDTNEAGFLTFSPDYLEAVKDINAVWEAEQHASRPRIKTKEEVVGCARMLGASAARTLSSTQRMLAGTPTEENWPYVSSLPCFLQMAI